MSNTPLLLVHAGMRPGEIIVARADGSDPVFVPPSDRVHHFSVGKNQSKEEWAVLRNYFEQQAPDVLIAFTSKEQADQALNELHKALLEPAPAQTEERPHFHPAYIVAGLLLLLALFLMLPDKKEQPPVAPQPSAAVVASPVDGQIVPADLGDLFLPAPGAPPQETVAPAAGGNLSPGESLLQQMQQGTPGGGEAQASPQAQVPQQQAAPASPGDSLLQTIKGN